MKTLILGGIKSGKSRMAEQIAERSALPVTLIATASADDREMALRIEKHRQSRPANWHTVEETLQLGDALQTLSGKDHCVVIDCITLWLTNLLMFPDDERLYVEINNLVNAIARHDGKLVIVSNETSMGIVPLGELTRRYCDEAGLLHQTLAKHCDNVILTIAGLPKILKGHYDA